MQEVFPVADIVEAEGAATALQLMRPSAVEIALVDVRMPNLDGLDLLRAMKAHKLGGRTGHHAFHLRERSPT